MRVEEQVRCTCISINVHVLLGQLTSDIGQPEHRVAVSDVRKQQFYWEVALAVVEVGRQLLEVLVDEIQAEILPVRRTVRQEGQIVQVDVVWDDVG